MRIGVEQGGVDERLAAEEQAGVVGPPAYGLAAAEGDQVEAHAVVAGEPLERRHIGGGVQQRRHLVLSGQLDPLAGTNAAARFILVHEEHEPWCAY